MQTRNWVFSLFVFLVAVPVGAAAYLGSVGLARERAMLIDRERREMVLRADEMRDRLVDTLQRLYRRESARPFDDYFAIETSPLRRNDTRAPLHDYFQISPVGAPVIPWGTPAEVPGDIRELARMRQAAQQADVPVGDNDRRERLHFATRDLVVREVRMADRQTWIQGFRVDAGRIEQRYLDPDSPQTILPPRERRPRLQRLRLVPENKRTLDQPGNGPFGLPLLIHRYVVPPESSREPALVPPGYLLSVALRPAPELAAALEEAEERLLWILGAVGVVVLLGMLFAWRAVREESRLAARKSEFVSAVSHELRTPLTSIRMYADMLKEGWVKDDGTAKEYFALISAESERLARLVNNVLDFSRIEKGRKTFQKQLGDPAPVIRDVGEVLAPYLEEKGFVLALDVPEHLPQCSFDKDALTQILVNLIDNAVKYGGREVRVEAEARDGQVVLRVLDRGPGIPESEREGIFQPFQRGSTAPRAGGSGLGLALVRHYAAGHGGRIEVSDRDGGGAIFSLILPAA